MLEKQKQEIVQSIKENKMFVEEGHLKMCPIRSAAGCGCNGTGTGVGTGC